MASHHDTWVVPATGQYVVKCGAGGSSGFRGENNYRGGGGGSGAVASKEFTETVGDNIDLLIPDAGPHNNTLNNGSAAVYAFARPSNCTAAGGTAPAFFGPVGKGGLAASCIGDVIQAGNDGGGPVPDFGVGDGHTGGASPDGTIGGTGGGVNVAAGGQDGPSPGGGGGGGGSRAANTDHSAESGGYIQIWRKADWPSYPSGSPTALPIASFGTPPPAPVSTIKAYAFVM